MVTAATVSLTFTSSVLCSCSCPARATDCFPSLATTPSIQWTGIDLTDSEIPSCPVSVSGGGHTCPTGKPASLFHCLADFASAVQNIPSQSFAWLTPSHHADLSSMSSPQHFTKWVPIPLPQLPSHQPLCFLPSTFHSPKHSCSVLSLLGYCLCF